MKNTNTKTALYIGRFQPFHNGHIDAIKQILSQNYTKIIIGIGSAQEERTENNPLTYYEREEIIQNTLKSLNIQHEIFPILDFNNNEKWAKYIITHAPEFQTIVSGNPHTQICFKQIKAKKQFQNLEVNNPTKATQIRKLIGEKNNKWKKLVPKEVEKMITNKLKKQLENILKPKDKSPSLAVDGIIETSKGIILIERKFPPLGYALPGGFVDLGESCETAFKREMLEEVTLKLENPKLFNVYSDPQRDPRKHVVSCVYTARTNQVPLAADDAKNVIEVPLENIGNYNLVFDHKQIIEDYQKTKRKEIQL